MAVLIDRIAVRRDGPGQGTLLAQYAVIPDSTQNDNIKVEYDVLGYVATNKTTGQNVSRGPLRFKTARTVVRMDEPPQMEYADLGPIPTPPAPDAIDLQRDEAKAPTQPYGVVIPDTMARYYNTKLGPS